MKKITISIFVILFLQTALAEIKSVKLTGFPTHPSTAEEVTGGLEALYGENLNQDEKGKQIRLTLDFQKTVYDSIEKAKSTHNSTISVSYNKKRLKGNFVTETTIKFPSLFQREGNHKANTVVAKVYESTTEGNNCDYKYPASIFLHHIRNELDMIEDAGAIMASGVLQQAGTIAVLHLPHYGERKEEGEDFLNKDYSKFRQNLAQLILDAHVLRLALAEMPRVDAQNISLSGISLGAVLGLTVSAFDQGFSRYAKLVGGGNLSNILANRAQNRPESEIALALKGSVIEETAIRSEIAAVDPIVWAHRIKDKKIFMLNASRDDIVDYAKSVKPVLEILKVNGNQIEQILNDDEHSPTGSGFKKLKKVFLPMLKFIVAGKPSVQAACSH